ncbi:adenosylmethionine--8-amino-7-oxononanoate transaminase [Kiritimatiella glycovorans]|uniref:Adenosylmethionine-8-amino-7-oxononanoate aminotransferase n=1 Tax=Kiritimatiella glycovorans TaxID=1307763 RepID=A0A0G3EMP1_9BACT|nr:adenosylmethionine--8-amino-7-oxononanoate transaminase [Kiritimatiella glycovorans]AKJ65374.1 Adenosylmethionine-8-amino-7-oxononanoate aminotransferase [Kiritimatiella glycovorans]
MNTEQLQQLDLQHLWHPYTRFSAQRAGLPVIERGEGVYLFDREGRRYLDAVSSWWACALGHGHPRLLEAMRRQSETLQHSILGNLIHPRAVELADEIARWMPTPERHVMFASDGASACEAALKIAVQYHYNRGTRGRTRFMSIEQDYHGDTIGALSVGYLEQFHRAYDGVIPRELRVPLPDYETGAGFEPTRRLMEEHGDTLAAVIVEPLCQGANGMRMYPAQYLADLAQACRERGIVMISDEIAMGFGRTGRNFAFEHAGIDPDIVCLGKALSSGYMPISATVVKDELFATFDDEREQDGTFYHGHTWCGHPIACAVALEALEIYREMDIAARAAKRGARMTEHFRELEGRPGVRDVRTLGMIAVAELEPAPDSRARADRIRAALLERDILVRPLGDVFYLMPPTIIDEEVLDGLCRDFVEILRKESSGS